MKNNISVADRRARIVTGLVLGLVGLATLGSVLDFSTGVGVVLTAVGLVLVGTGVVRMCPLYRLLGIDTSNP